jgi:hypothetical protein
MPQVGIRESGLFDDLLPHGLGDRLLKLAESGFGPELVCRVNGYPAAGEAATQ